MTQPLALVLYERILPGSQVVNRLQDLNYRVQTLTDARLLTQCAEQAKPLVVLADLEPGHGEVVSSIKQLLQNPATKHLPVIGFGAERASEVQTAAQEAGVRLLVGDTAILNHLPECLDQAMQLD
jgi:CheY-like chemotaxis protein